MLFSVRRAVTNVILLVSFAFPVLLVAQSAEPEQQPQPPEAQGEANRGASVAVPATAVPQSSTIRLPPLTTWEKFKYHM